MSKFVFIQTGKITQKVLIDDVVLIQALGNYVQIHTKENKKYTSYYSLKGLIEKLPDEFMRIHNSYIVNLNHIEKIEDNHVYLNEEKIPVSAGKKDCLDKRVNQYRL